jgi:glycosyltransferase involved in cell wall biosynthesis
MRVAFVIPYFYPAMWYGGTPRSAYETARALARRGHEVTVFTTDSAGPGRIPRETIANFQRIGLDGVQVYYYRNFSNYLACRHRIFAPLSFFKEARRRLSESQIVHIHELRSFLSAAAHSALHPLPIPYVVSLHGGLRHLGKKAVKEAFDFVWGRKILTDAAAICALSPLEESDALAFGIARDRIHRFPSPIDTVHYKELPSEGQFASRWNLNDRRIVLFLGRLHWIKGADVLVESISLMKDLSNLQVVIAGPDDGAETSLRSLIRRRGLENMVSFTGFLDDRQKVQAMVDSDVVVVPSRSEAFPITPLEAMACGTPTIVSSACDLEDWIPKQPTWSKFSNGDPEDLAEKLKTILRNRPGPKETSENREYILSEFSSEALASKFEGLYESVLRDGGRIRGQ